MSLSKGEIGADVSNALGRFIVASITSIALRRARHKGYRRPIHLIIDECHNYIGKSVETILTEARKYGLHLTLANQNIWQIRDTSIRKTLLANTSVKCIGATSAESAKDLALEIDVSRKQIQCLKVGHFLVKASRTRKAFLLKASKKLLGSKNAMSSKAWDSVIDQQLEHYYQSTHTYPKGARMHLFYTKSSPKDLAQESPIELPWLDVTHTKTGIVSA